MRIAAAKNGNVSMWLGKFRWGRPGRGLSGGISVSRGLAAHLRPYCRFAACAAATSCTKPQTIAAARIDSSKLIAIGCLPICKKSVRSRVPFREFGNLGIEVIPGIAARAEQHDGRFERAGIVKRADIDADKLRLLVRLVIDRRAAVRTKPLALDCAAVGSALDFAHLACHRDCAAREHEDGAVAAAGVALTVAALALEAADRRGRDGVTNRAAGATT